MSLEVEDGNLQSEALQRVGSELAMHVVAAKPLFLTRELVTSEALENEREILKSQVIGDNWWYLFVICGQKRRNWYVWQDQALKWT